MIIPIIVLAVMGLGILIFRMYRAELTGWAGEMLLHYYLKNKLDKKQYIVLHDIMLPTAEGVTTQIDHIVVSQWGVFVIETKSYSGSIYGKASEPQWTAKYNPRQKGFSFQNPIRQNYKHIATLSECLGIDQLYFKTIIAFSGAAKFGKDMPHEVMHFRNVPDYLREHSKDIIIPHEQIQEVAETIIAWQATLTHSQKSSHVENLRKSHVKAETIEEKSPIIDEFSSAPSPEDSTKHHHSSSTIPMCPKCNVAMVLRTRKSDGGKFWGCPNYPKCRSIVEIKDVE